MSSTRLSATRRRWLTGAGALLGAGGLVPRSVRAQGAQASSETIFSGGPILTMNDAAPTAEAVAVRDGLVVAVGSLDAVRAAAASNAQWVDLDGRTLLPGFFDAHGHVSMVGLQARSVNLLPAPDGAGEDIPALQRLTRDWMTDNQALWRSANLVIGFGYDDSQLKEHRHPTGRELDAISDSMPILFVHQSGHMGSANRAALEAAGISASTPTPKAGCFVVRRARSNPMA